MRTSLVSPVGAGLKKDHRLSEWFWDHEFRLCQRHNERDWQKQQQYLDRLVEPRTERRKPSRTP
jgi:hypothetical protein